MDFNAAIFDLDGTILDSMDVWEHIDIQFLKKRNLPVPDNYVTEICARSFEEAAQYTIDLFGLQETVEGIIEEWNNMAVEEYRNHVGLLPYALDYLLRLKEHGIKLAVATGLPENLYIPSSFDASHPSLHHNPQKGEPDTIPHLDTLSVLSFAAGSLLPTYQLPLLPQPKSIVLPDYKAV